MTLLDYRTTRDYLDATPEALLASVEDLGLGKWGDAEEIRRALDLARDPGDDREWWHCHWYQCQPVLELLALHRFRTHNPHEELVNLRCAAMLVVELTTGMSYIDLDGFEKPQWVEQQIMHLLGGSLGDQGWGWAPGWMFQNEGMPGLDQQATTVLVLRLIEVLFFAPGAEQSLPEIEKALDTIRQGDRERGEELLDAALAFAAMV